MNKVCCKTQQEKLSLVPSVKLKPATTQEEDRLGPVYFGEPGAFPIIWVRSTVTQQSVHHV